MVPDNTTKSFHLPELAQNWRSDGRMTELVLRWDHPHNLLLSSDSLMQPSLISAPPPAATVRNLSRGTEPVLHLAWCHFSPPQSYPPQTAGVRVAPRVLRPPFGQVRRMRPGHQGTCRFFSAALQPIDSSVPGQRAAQNLSRCSSCCPTHYRCCRQWSRLKTRPNLAPRASL